MMDSDEAVSMESLIEQLKKEPRAKLVLPAGKGGRAKEVQKAIAVVGGVYKCKRCTRWHVAPASGFLIAEDLVVTNYHVVDQPERSGLAVRLFDGRVFMVEAVVAEFGGVDILINYAGLYLFTPLEGTTEAEWDQQLDTALKGPFFCAQAAVPHMKARGGGKIINIGSIFGEDGFPGSSGYCASKGAIKQLPRSLCLELRPFNIQVNTLSPGCIETDLNKEYREESEDFTRALQERFGAGNPWLQPEEMAGTAVFLASSDADSVTGANVMVDRGYSAY